MSQIEIIKYDFDESVKSELTDNQKVKNLWPIVYIINDKYIKEAYVGETTDGISRMSNHLKNDKKNKSHAEESWQWALAFELSTILGIVVQLIAIIIFFIYLNVSYGLINFLIVAIVLQFLSYLFSKQIQIQKSFSKSQKNNKSISSSVKVMARIKSGEIGVLMAGASFLLSIGILIYFSFGQSISPAHSIVLFFGIKMQSSSLSMLSTSLMRFARARVNSE